MQQKTRLDSEAFDKKLLLMSIQPKNENFLDLKTLSRKTDTHIIFTAPQHNTIYFLRETVALSLMKAAKYFSGLGFTLNVESAYRSVSMQKKLFTKRYESFKKNNPGKTKEELLHMANTYTAGIPVLAAHCAGAAADVTLLDTHGQPVDFGVPYPYGGSEAATLFPGFSQNVKKNRKILKDGMEKFGFTNYPFEYWHYSVGDVCAAFIRGQKNAIYGPVEFDPTTGFMHYAVDEKDQRRYFDI